VLIEAELGKHAFKTKMRIVSHKRIVFDN
jgi:hypothetical protein